MIVEAVDTAVTLGWALAAAVTLRCRFRAHRKPVGGLGGVRGPSRRPGRSWRL